MDRLARELELARDAFAPEWNGERSQRLYDATRALGARRRRVRIGQATLFTLAVAAVAFLAIERKPALPGQPAALASAPRSEHSLRLADGSRAELVGEHSEIEIIDNQKARVGLRLLSGRAHFEVVPNTMRSFVVEAQPYRVEVIGTIFEVERSSREVGVSVQRGKVRVYGPRGAEDLVAGQIKHFALGPNGVNGAPAEPQAVDGSPREDESGDETSPGDERAGRHPSHSHAHPSAKRGQSGAGWRSLSQSGQYEAAFDGLSRGEAVEDEPSALMDAADAARLSGHAQNAVQYLERVVNLHRASPVAPLAAFTLGRVYLDQLGQPGGAAQAFELARTLAPRGSLAQDALAREVEALSKGGNAHLAYLRAHEYLRLYPHGQRLHAVQLYGGLE